MEYYVINNSPDATARMYNYLVIAGLFRSLSFIFLTVTWIYGIIYVFERPHINQEMMKFNFIDEHLIWATAYIFLYIFCLFSFAKFQRRYTEEAIFAFVMND